MLVKRLLAMLLVTFAGILVAIWSGSYDLQNSSAYLVMAIALLVLGLYSSTHGIERAEIAGNVRLVVVAVTIGVVLKAALIASVMYLAFPSRPEYVVLAVAVAQIDPLSVAVIRDRARLSPRAKAILSAWSSFDDPVTAVLVVYLAALAWMLSGRSGPGPGVAGSVGDVTTGLLLNLLLIIGLGAVWIALRMIGRRLPSRMVNIPILMRILAVLALLAAGAFAVDNLLVFGMAVVGLFYRPGIGPALRWITPVAFLMALFMLGLVLAEGVNLGAGIVLGCAAFAAQIVVGALLTRSLHGDRARLALSQQNGITAVILALLLETAFPGTVAIVAPAILVVGVLHLVANTVQDRIEDRVLLGVHPASVMPGAAKSDARLPRTESVAQPGLEVPSHRPSAQGRAAAGG